MVAHLCLVWPCPICTDNYVAPATTDWLEETPLQRAMDAANELDEMGLRILAAHIDGLMFIQWGADE